MAPKKKQAKINQKKFMDAISFVESRNGKYMKNPRSSASGLYGQLYDSIDPNFLKEKGIRSRDAFIGDTTVQNDYMLKRMAGDMFNTPRKTNLFQDAYDLTEEYKPQLGDDFTYTEDEVAALSHFLGRQGTRNYFGWAKRDKDRAKFDKWHKSKGINKSPEEYLELYNQGWGDRTLPTRESLNIPNYAEGGELNTNSNKMATTLTAEKAKKILKDGKVNGKPLTDKQKRYFGFIAGGGVPSKAEGGNLSREKDYGSKKKPYPKVKSGDFAGGGRSYPIPTKANAVDALRLAGLHGRDDVKAKVYKRYPSLRKAEGGELDELGLGDWIKDNKQGVIGGVKTAAGIGAMFIPGGQGIGTNLIASGVGDIGNEIISDRANDKLDANRTAADQAAAKAAYAQGTLPGLYERANQGNNFQTLQHGGPIEYTGQSHQGPDGGIPVDDQGNPVVVTNREPIAKVERGERAFKDPDTGKPYVMPKDKSKIVDKVFKRAEFRLGKDFSNPDLITKKGLDRSLRNLIAMNEANKSKKNKSVQMAEGGDLDDWMTHPTWNNMNTNPGTIPGVNAPTEIPEVTITANRPLAGRSTEIIGPNGPMADTGASPYPTGAMDLGVDPNKYTYTPADTTGAMGDQPWSPAKSQAIGAGVNALAGAAGNIVLASTLPEPERMSAPKISAPRISLAEQRQQADVDATEAVSRGMTRARSAGLNKRSRQAILNQLDADVTRNLGKVKSESLLAERNINATRQLQVDVQNQSIAARASQINAMRKDQFIRDKYGLYSQALGNITGGIRDIGKIYGDSQFLDVLSARSGYQYVKGPDGKVKLSAIPEYWKNKQTF